MENMMAILNEYQVVVGLFLALLITSILLYFYWEKFSFYWLRVTCSFPFIGKVARLKRNMSTTDDGWFHAEKALASEFQPYYTEVNKDGNYYDSCKSYLKKVTENGRKELPVILWIVLIALVFGEAMGFSYVLAGYTIPGASEDLQQQASLVLAFMISVLLVFMTHLMGSELHHNRLVNKIRTWFNQKNYDGEDLSPDTSVDLSHDHLDDGERNYKQLLNRLDTNATVTPSYIITIVTVLFIVGVAIGATYVRGQVLEQMLTEDQQEMQSDSGAYSDPYGSPVPEGILTEIQEASDNQVTADIISSQRKGGWGTFIVLAIIFVFLQIMGILIGLRYGFTGKESKTAYKYIGRFKTRDQFESFYQRRKDFIAQIAQKNLSDLQKKLVEYARSNTTENTVKELSRDTAHRTFYKYAEIEEAKKNDYERNSHTASVVHQQFVASALQEPVQAAPIATQSITQSALVEPETTKPAGTPSDVITYESEPSDIEKRIERIKARKAAENKKAEQVAYMATLESDEELEAYMIEQKML